MKFTCLIAAAAVAVTSADGGSSVLCGVENYCDGWGGLVGGGQYNSNKAKYGCVTGGTLQEISDAAEAGTISGGQSNLVTAKYGTISGGRKNKAYSNYATCIGGFLNKASGRFATTLGGSKNSATGRYTVASGFKAVANGDYSGTFSFYSSFAKEAIPATPDMACVGNDDETMTVCAMNAEFRSDMTITGDLTVIGKVNGVSRRLDESLEQDVATLQKEVLALREMIAAMQ